MRTKPPIWSVIRGLMDEAHDDLRLNGYTERQGFEATFDLEVTTERCEDITGALVFAYDEEGNRAERAVWYPDDWAERAGVK